MKFDVELVGKIGSMALINKENNILDYTLIARLSSELKPGYIWVTSGAAETGRLDYIKRTGKELKGEAEDVKTDYAAQGQSILMSTYRQYVDSKYSLRQVLVEHQHFNDEQKREHLRALLIRAKEQNAIPIINYNDAISTEESRRFEIQSLKSKKNKVVECVDNDETASQIACLVKAKTLLILTSALGIYKDSKNPDTLIEEISGKEIADVLSSPNNILGVEYIKAINKLKLNMEINPVTRKGVAHDSEQTNGDFCSASAIREMLESKKSFDGFLIVLKE